MDSFLKKQRDVIEPYPLSPATRHFLDQPRRMCIDGQWVEAQGGKTFDVFDPATGEVIARVPAAGADDVDQAVRAARQAFETGAWPQTKPIERQRMMLRLADLIEDNLQELAEIETLDNGKALSLSTTSDVPKTAAFFRYMAGWATKIQGDTVDVSTPGNHSVSVRRLPVGVVAGISAWNYPLHMASHKIAPALATGCTIIYKPAEQTPLTALRLAELVEEAGFPPGVVNVVTGIGADAGASLVAHSGVDKVTFTGSVETGKLVARAAVEHMAHVTMELGGKAPVIVHADADLKKVIPGAARAIFSNQGQICCAGSRLIAHQSVYDEVVAGIAEIAGALTIAPGFDPDCQIAPLVSAAQQQRVRHYIKIGVDEGAELVVGGEVPESSGYFVAPTVLANARTDMRVAAEEIFGPVLVAQSFCEEEEALHLANNTQYGLGASVWTQDISKAMRAADAINAGNIWINSHGMVDASTPFGGTKMSGLGREFGREHLEAYLESKTVWIAY